MATHISIFEEFNFREMIEVSAEGQAGGMVILWNHNRVVVNNFTRRNQEIHAMIKKGINSTVQKQIKIHWHKPPKGWYKFNIDGAFIGNIFQGGIGGVARNNTGSWILAFHMKVPTLSVTQVELQALRGCLQIIMQHNLTPVKIETDASETINMLDNDHHTYPKLIYECRWLMKQTRRKDQVVLRHSFGQGNGVAHALAKMALMQTNINKVSLMATPPEPAIQPYQKDLEGFYFVKYVCASTCLKLVALGNLDALYGTDNIM
ncbi:PREDICTED: uncharacterized protein LOC109211100 [Nicotiana attenuata]|uniref:uncharacterized protein LOC109211100 n=1 Tax=Nicotiana attenuata TaxID=49451 RepID=UPI000905BD14|nr:PREDICTED: uncharacterized protein LOC109211100 [Nicotiana attenuata]